MKLALVTLSAQGGCVVGRLAEKLAEADVFVHEHADFAGKAERFQHLTELAGRLFESHRAIVFVAPCGAVLRAIAPHLRHKSTDPAVVVLDVGARHAISLLGGHEAGANHLAVRVASIVGAEPVITTTTEAARDLVVGIGCRRDTASADILAAITAALAEVGLPLARVRLLASADVKADEPGLHSAADSLGLPLLLVPADTIRGTCLTFARTPLAERKLGLPAVAEPCALLAGRRTTLVLPKRIFSGVTIAIAQERLPWSASVPATRSTAPAAPSAPSPPARSS